MIKYDWKKATPEMSEKEVQKLLKENKKNAEKIAQAKDEIENKYIPSPYPNPELFNRKTEKRDNYTYIPSSENVIKKNSQTEQLKYIPSQLAGNFTKTFDNSGLQSALARADRAEQRALQVLAGKFGPM